MPYARRQAGVTLLEMMVVVAIIAMIAGISFPAISSGLDSIRLRSAADSVASFLNSAVNRAERREEVVAIVSDPKQNQLALFCTNAVCSRTLEFPTGIRLLGEAEKQVVLMPGGAFPNFTVDLVNNKGVRKRITLDSITGASQITDLREPSV